MTSSHMAHDWHNIGITYDLESYLLRAIEQVYYRKVRDCLREMLSLWLENATTPPTWEELAVALEGADYPGIASKARNM